MNSYPYQTPVFLLLDRNVVALIKQAVTGGKQRDPRKQAYVDALRTLDVPENSVSPILSIMEGERG